MAINLTGSGINFTFKQALAAYNSDQVMTQTMWHVSPTGSWGGQDPIIKAMQIYGQGFEAPARTNDFGTVAYRGYEIPTPTVPKMTQEHSITLNCDSQQLLRTAFIDVMNRAIDADIDHQDNSASFAADRRPTEGVGAANLDLTLLGPDYQTPILTYRMYGVRVSEVGTLSLSNTDGGIATFTVQFKSVYWTLQEFRPAKPAQG